MKQTIEPEVIEPFKVETVTKQYEQVLVDEEHMKILHIINSLDMGGADADAGEAQQCTEPLPRMTFWLSPCWMLVCWLVKLRLPAVSIISLGLGQKSCQLALSLFRLASIINKFKPDIIRSWLYQSDLVAGIMGWLANAPVIWGVRQSNLSAEHNKFSTRIVVRLCAVLSGMLPETDYFKFRKGKMCASTRPDIMINSVSFQMDLRQRDVFA